MKKKITKAFKELRELGFFARQNFWCCQSCALSGIPDDKPNYVFYHNQDNSMLRKTGTCYLSWGGDANTIISILKNNDIKVEWNQTANERILININ